MVKTSELTGAALDWAVAKCAEVSVRWSEAHRQILLVGRPYVVWQPHKNWAQGGPIIEREEIALAPGYYWEANKQIDVRGLSQYVVERGETTLIAAMRCYVASKLGDEVQLPEELS